MQTMDIQKKIRVLFVDDEKMICTMAKDLMEYYGYEIDIFDNSLYAFERFSKHPDDYDILVTDQTMADLTGYELSRKILSIKKDLPVIICSGFSKNIEELKENTLGVSAFFIKPFNIQDLIDQIEKLV